MELKSQIYTITKISYLPNNKTGTAQLISSNSSLNLIWSIKEYLMETLGMSESSFSEVWNKIFNKKKDCLIKSNYNSGTLPIHISLGSNCSITYQLEAYGLRTCLYPFDWTKITLNQLIKVLESDFESYSSTLEVKAFSPAHSSLLLNNEYGVCLLKQSSNSDLAQAVCLLKQAVQFDHELTNNKQDKDNKDEFEISIERRIDRFRALKNNTNIRFYRIELSCLNLGYINKLNKLCELLSLFVQNFQLVLLIQEDSWDFIPWNKVKYINQIQIIKFKSFDTDWKMEQINWKEVFGLNYV